MDLNSIFAFLGIVTSGALIATGVENGLFYLKNKRLPPHPAELERDHIQKKAQIEIETLQTENTRLKSLLQKAESDLEDIWKKTLNRIQ